MASSTCAPGHDLDGVRELRSLTELEDRQAWFMQYVAGNNRDDNPQLLIKARATIQDGYLEVVTSVDH